MKLNFIIFHFFWFGTLVNSAPILSSRNSQDTAEAISIALESTGELIPELELISKIQSDLRLIRKLNPSLTKRVHHGKWRPGQLLARGLSRTQVQEVEDSEFKPVKVLPRGIGNVLLLFKKNYHPIHLAKLLKLRFGFDSKPNYLVDKEDDDHDHILYRHDLSSYFWNSVNGKNCLDGCFAQYSVSFSDGSQNENGFQSDNNELDTA